MTATNSPESSRHAGLVLLPPSPASWALLAFAVLLAACAAATVQPADFTPRQAAAFVAIALAGVFCSFAGARVGIAWPLLSGLAIAATYRLAYDPVLPDAIMAHVPVRIALLEPTVPMLLAAVAVIVWALWPRARLADHSLTEALAALRRTAQLVIATALVMYLALSGIYDLEGGYWFWRLTVTASLYLGLLWLGIEGAARHLLTPSHAAVLFAGILISVGRSLVSLAGGGG